jgi:hypothetical protein
MNFSEKSSKQINEVIRFSSKSFLPFSRLLSDGEMKLKGEIFIQTIQPSLRHLIVYICKQWNEKGARNYAQQQLNDIQNDLNRIRCMINYYILDELIGRYSTISKTDHLSDMKMLTNKSGSFTKEDHQRFGELVEKCKSERFLSGSNLIEEKSLSIIDTFKMETGYWFACRNNHVYYIDQVRIRMLLFE